VRNAVRIGALLAATTTAAGTALASEARRAPEHLHDTGLYLPGGLTVRPGTLAFSPQYPLWSDGAHKRRWIRLPPGSAIDARRPDAWRFPVGTRLWKEFSFDGHPVETRYLERRRDGSWLFASYVWNEAGTDAVLAPDGGTVRPHPREPGGRYDIPGGADCRACHESGATPVLGFGALQLSSDRDPRAPHAERPRPDEVNLETLLARGLVRGLPARLRAQPPRIAAASPDGRAALGYMHANCGTCHNASGPLAALGMTLAHSLDATSPPEAPGLRTTVGQPNHAPVPGAGTTALMRIAPGRPAQSAVLLRARSRHALLQMPPLGTRQVDREAVVLLERWIANDLAPTTATKENAP